MVYSTRVASHKYRPPSLCIDDLYTGDKVIIVDIPSYDDWASTICFRSIFHSVPIGSINIFVLWMFSISSLPRYSSADGILQQVIYSGPMHFPNILSSDEGMGTRHLIKGLLNRHMERLPLCLYKSSQWCQFRKPLLAIQHIIFQYDAKCFR